MTIGLGDFDIETVHLVVVDFEGIDAGSRFFTQFQLLQILVRASGHGAQFIKLGIIASCYDPTIANDHWGRIYDGIQ